MKVRFKLQMLFSEPPKKVLRRAKGRSGLSRSPRIPPGGNDPLTATARGEERKGKGRGAVIGSIKSSKLRSYTYIYIYDI